MKHLKYLRYIVRHKWFVLVECWKRGLYWRGLVHDLSKLRPSEWFPYAQYFYGDNTGEGLEAIGRFGCCEAAPYGFYAKDRFNFAWLHHQNRNKHHWQYWVRIDDNQSYRGPMPMPAKYRAEMLCDWIGAGRAITGKRDVAGWYRKNKDKMLLHPETQAWVADKIAEISEDEE